MCRHAHRKATQSLLTASQNHSQGQSFFSAVLEMTDTIIMAFITAMIIVTLMMTITISHTQASEGSFDRRTELMVRVRALLSKGQGCDRKG